MRYVLPHDVFLVNEDAHVVSRLSLQRSSPHPRKVARENDAAVA